MEVREFPGKMALAAGIYGKERDYWLDKLSGELVKTSFPYDYNKTGVDVDRRETDKIRKLKVSHIELDSKLVERIMKIGKNSDYTLHMMLVAGSVALLGKYTGNKDIMVGVPIYKKDIEGEFLNTVLVLRNRLTGNMSFRELLVQVRQTIVEADKHQNYPIETLLYHLNMTFSGNDFPLFDFVVLLENIHQKRDIEHTYPNVIFSFLRTPGCIEGNVEYNSFLYRKETMERILTHFTRLLEEAVFNIEMPVLGIDILSWEEKEKLLYDFNRTETDYPGDKTIDRLFEDQAARTPCKAAVIDEEDCLTYGMLNERARGLAVYLQGKGLMKEEAVGIMVENSVGMIIGILGILKAGGAYLPLNSEYPEERRRYLLKDGNAVKLLINAQHEGNGNCYEGVDVIRIDDPGIYSAAGSPGRNHSFNNLAYIMYTSGSTGNPKGVMIEHRSVVRLVKNTDYVEFREEDRILQTGALDFDASTFEIWGALLNGLQLYLACKEIILTPDTLKSLIWEKRITTIWMTSPLFNQMVDADMEIFKGLRNLLVGGDTLSPPHINRVRAAFPGLKVINGYGPTENTTFSVTHLIEWEYKQGIPIGKPISNSTAYIIDQQDYLAPIGAVGELCVGGDGLARGYLNNPELTAERFDQDLLDYQDYHDDNYQKFLRGSRGRFLQKEPPGRRRLYKTGDLARWLPEGNIEFLGRIDHQVKIRGYRIELGEIENQLSRLANIDEAVLVDKEIGGEKYLCAYVVSEGSEGLDAVELKNALSKNLPDYMIPSHFVRVDKIPLGPTGKVDRKALPEPEVKAGENYVAPRDDTEKRMVDIWSEVLGVEKEIIGIDTDFFELGGHSLKATLLTDRLHKEFNVKVPLAKIFKTPFIRELSGYIKGAAEHKHKSIKNVEKKEYYELSAAQKRLYIIWQMGKASTNYNVSIPLVLEGDLNHSKLEETFRNLINRHESLRTSFHMKENRPVQKVHDRVEFSIRYYEGAAGKGNVDTIIRNFVQSFDLSRAPLLKVGLVKLKEIEHILIIDIHHIVTDGTSLQIMVEELMALYRGEELPKIRLQYKDFSGWQNKRFLSGEIKKQEDYWLKLYEGDIPQLDLPTDFERLPGRNFAGGAVLFELSGEETAALNRLALNEGVTLYMLLLAIYNVFLAKLSNQEDILVGTSTAGRRHADLGPVFGMFVNTLCLRNFPGSERTFDEFLQDVKQRTVEAFENQEYQFEELVEKLAVKRIPGGNPIFNVSFSFHNEMESTGISEIDIPGLRLKLYDSDVTTSNFDFTLQGMEIDEKLFFSFHYSTALFEKESIEMYTTYFKRIVSSVIENPNQRIYEVKMIFGSKEQSMLSHAYDDLEIMSGLCFQDRLLPGFQKYGRNIALQYGAKKVAYWELDKRSECILNWLLENDVEKESFIGIYIKDKSDFIAAMIGIIKAGCVFVPLDTGLPVKRIENMVRMTHTRIIISDDGNQKCLFRDGSGMGEDLKIVAINDSFYDAHGVRSSAWCSIPYSPEDKIYVYFTSGSTGIPKAVVGKNKSLLHFIDWEISTFSIDESYRVSQLNSPGFDGFLADVFVPLSAGGTVCIPDSKDMMNSDRLINWIDRNQIHLIHCVPGLYKSFNSDASGKQNFKHLKYILLAGDSINPSELTKWYDKFDERIQLVNLYGPTETMVKTFYFIDRENIPKSRIPIGKPMEGSRVFILDKQLNICGEKTIGEIYIRTPYGTSGYYNDPGLTNRRFIPNPFSGDRNDLFYKTGDLGRMLLDGNIEFLGRKDRQVKIKGVRVEPEEIENAMLTHPAIAEAVVTGLEDSNGETYLCAYYVTGEAVKSAELMEYLAVMLPFYMIPARLVQVKKMPLLPGGKIDFDTLPLPGTVTEETESGVPGDEIERTLVKIWSEVLEIDEASIGVDDFFVDLNGQSLKAIMMSSWIHREFDVSIPIHAIFELSTIKMLAEYIKKSVVDKYHTIEPAEEKEYYALSPGQKRLYIIKRMELEGIGYNVPQIVVFEGNLDIEKLAGVFNQLINRHESFRTSFEMVGDEPVQRIHKHIDFSIEYYEPGEGSGVPLKSAEVNGIIKNFIRPFNLEQAPLLRVGLIHTPRSGTQPSQEGNSEDKYILMTDMHHIISDAASRGILLEGFLDLYEGKGLPVLKLQYKDYSEWVNSPARRQVMKRQEEYWLEQFFGEIPVLNLPIDFPRPKVQSFEGGFVGLEIGKKETTALQKLAMEENATMFMVLLAVFNVFLAKISGQEDIVVGTPVVGRQHTDLEKIVGIFINTLALRNYPVGEKTFKEFLRDLRQRSFNAFENQQYPYEDLVDCLSVKRDMSRNPLCDVMFGYREVKENNRDISRMGLSLADQDLYDNEAIISKFDLLLGATFGENLYLSFEYASKLFKRETIERFIVYLKKILLHIMDEPDIKLWQIDIISEEEKRKLLYDFNDANTTYPKDKTIHQLFGEQVERRPERIAVVGSWQLAIVKEKRSGETVQLTYRELNRKSGQLAHLLKEEGVQPDTIVGLAAERSIEMIIGILGVLKAGGAYLPIDPEYPQKRVDHMLNDSGAKVLLTSSAAQVKEKEESIEISDIFKGISSPILTSTCEVSLANLAYVIYTSGTTGKPKGTLTTHSNVIRVVKNTNYLDLTPQDRILQLSNYAFDGSVFDIYGALLNGAALVMLPAEKAVAVDKLVEVITKEKITVFFVTTALFNLLVDAEPCIFDNIRHVLFGGERVSVEHAQKALTYSGKGSILHMYGPTESTVYATFYPINAIEENAVTIPIGKPLSGTAVYILDSYLKPVSVGIIGEIYIGGCGTARGYLNRVELTAEKFIASPFVSGDRLYETGDLARWLPDGNIEFSGRIDHQIKLRGFRIELGEIETHLLDYKDIKEALVIAGEFTVGDGFGELKEDRYICAYFVAEKELSSSEIRDYLSNRLPDYMIPSYFMQLGKIPLNPNGKVDRKALPSPVLKASGKYAAPRDEIEKKLAEIWGDILGRHISQASPELPVSFDQSSGVMPIGIDDNFFELGGHSLNATIMVSKIQKELNVKLPLAEVFKTATIRGLAQTIRAAAVVRYVSIEPAEEKEYYVLSSAQKRLYILQQMEFESTAYNIPVVILLEEQPDIEKFEKAFRKLISRHESLRTSFHLVEHHPVQRVREEVEFGIEYYDLAAKNEAVKDRSDIIKDFIRPFDLSQAPLLRFGLTKIGHQECLLMIDMHHIISDGLSHKVLEKDFMEFYEGKELPPLRIQYKDFSHWQNSEKEKEIIKKQEQYWLKEFEGEIPVLALPTDFVRPVVQSFEGGGVSFEISEQESAALKRLSLQAGATLFMVLLGAVNILLAKLSSQEDIIVGTPIAGRRHPDLGKIIGMFVNTLALRSYPCGEQTFREFLNDVKKRTLEAFENQDYPFEDLVERAAVSRDAGRNPLFDVMFALQSVDIIPGDRVKNETLDQSTQTVSPWDDENVEQVSKFDLSLTAVDAYPERTLRFSFQYGTKLFKKETIHRFIGYFKKIVSTIVKEPDKRLSRLGIISAEEKKRLLYDFNDTETQYPGDKPLHQLFEGQVDRTPDNTAIVGGRQLAITYKELNERSNQLARVLKEKGVKLDGVVGVMMNRSIEMVVGIWGILKAGGAYLPIDPDYPQERIDYMLADSNAKILLISSAVQGKVKAEVKEESIEIIDISEGFSSSTLTLTSTSGPAASADGLAYVIYTSGSTGNPKGVGIEHRAAVNIICSLFNQYPFSQRDTYLFKTPYIFDVSVSELFGWFSGGGRLAILEDGEEKDAQKISGAIEHLGVSHINFVPSMFNVFVDFLNAQNIGQLSSLRYIFLAGEALSPRLVKKFGQLKSKIPLENIYGPTEAAVYSSKYSISQWDGFGGISIGKPLHNVKLYILDAYKNVQPVGVVGELCIAGEGLARGYLNRPELSAERFVDYRSNRSYRTYFPGKIYKTGDLARWLPDGNVEFLGRMDHQVKIRGYRIELGEIESQLLKHQEVKEAVVSARKDDDSGDDVYLCAYVVPTSDIATGDGAFEEKPSMVSKLRNYLSQSLPDYMVPSYFMELEKMPLTPGGKIDSKALPVPVVKIEDQYTAPRDKVEETLVEIWGSILKIEMSLIGIDANFFKLGGHSLKATSLISRIHKEMDVKVPLVEIFKTPSIRGLARYIREVGKDKYEAVAVAEEREYYPLSTAQKGVFVQQQKARHTTVYNMPQVMSLDFAVDIERLERTFRKLIERHETLRTSFETVAGNAVQIIHEPKDTEFEIEYHEESSPGEFKRIARDFIRPFDLSAAPLLRAGVVKTGGERYILMFDIHHIISDGISQQVAQKEFIALYNNEPLLPLRIHYKDYSVWLNSSRVREEIQGQKGFWLKTFEDNIPQLKMPHDFKRPAVKNFEGDYLCFTIKRELTHCVHRFAEQAGATLYMLLLAVYFVLLSKYSNQEDLVVGTPVTGRRDLDLHHIIGMFVNMLAIRSRPVGNKTFAEFLEEVKHSVINSMENQDFHFEELVTALGLQGDPGRNPLFDAAFSMQNFEGGEIRDRNPGIGNSQESENYGKETRGDKEADKFGFNVSRFDLLLNAEEIDGQLEMYLEYSTQLFKRATIEKISERYVEILAHVVENENRDIKLKDIKVSLKLAAMEVGDLRDSGDFGF